MSNIILAEIVARISEIVWVIKEMQMVTRGLISFFMPLMPYFTFWGQQVARLI